MPFASVVRLISYYFMEQHVSRIIMLSMALVISSSLAACADAPVSSGGGDTVVAANEPEFVTGSYIARKKNKAPAADVKSLPPEQLEETQRNSSQPVH